jgi:hypothetical protein
VWLIGLNFEASIGLEAENLNWGGRSRNDI